MKIIETINNFAMVSKTDYISAGLIIKSFM